MAWSGRPLLIWMRADTSLCFCSLHVKGTFFWFSRCWWTFFTLSKTDLLLSVLTGRLCSKRQQGHSCDPWHLSGDDRSKAYLSVSPSLQSKVRSITLSSAPGGFVNSLRRLCESSLSSTAMRQKCLKTHVAEGREGGLLENLRSKYSISDPDSTAGASPGTHTQTQAHILFYLHYFISGYVI